MLPEDICDYLSDFVLAIPGDSVDDETRTYIADLLDAYARYLSSIADATEEYSDKLAEIEDEIATLSADWELDRMDTEINANREAAHSILTELKKTLTPAQE